MAARKPRAKKEVQAELPDLEPKVKIMRPVLSLPLSAQVRDYAAVMGIPAQSVVNMALIQFFKSN